MFDVTDEPVKAKDMPERQVINPSEPSKADEATRQRHAVLYQAMRDESELQAEERLQMAIDHDYYDHLQWREEDAEVLIERGQAPLVFNEARQSIDWVCGMQKRLRMDDEVLPREPNDQQSAEVKSKVFKFISDTNLAPWHESRAYKSAVIGGLGWLEEGINTDPTKHLIDSSSEDWRNVLRDSRSRDFDMDDARYLFRRKRIDLDYACALLPKAKQHLITHADTDAEDAHMLGEDVWYLGERLTGASDLPGYSMALPYGYRDRGAFIGSSEMKDHGRRLAVDLVEAWYRVPESAEFFAAGPLRGKRFDPKDQGHQQLLNDRWRTYSAVVMRMRVMIMSESHPLWDGVSPYKHGKFPLVPVWGFRRGRDGMCYGLMRGMRDLNDSLNKLASKAQHAASSNRVAYEDGAFDDEEIARQEAARPDMFLKLRSGGLQKVKFEKPVQDVSISLEQMNMTREMLRNSGGVTDANLGRDSKAVSGKAIGLQQDQGSLTTSELPDNLRLAKQIAGRIRLAHIEQFMTEQQAFRITGEGQPTQWITVNEQQPDGTILNDLAATEADYVIGERNYRETYAQAAMESMMELLTKIGAYAPQVVLNVLDLVVDSAEVPNKDEWVARLRKLNGQRDPKKPPTPEEEAQAQADAQDAAKAKQIQLETLEQGLAKLKAEVSKLDTAAILERVNAMNTALQAAQIVALTPGVAPVADTIAAGAGFKDQGGEDPQIPAAAAQPAETIPPAQPEPAPAAEPMPGEEQQPMPPADAGAAMPEGAPQ